MLCLISLNLINFYDFFYLQLIYFCFHNYILCDYIIIIVIFFSYLQKKFQNQFIKKFIEII